MELYKKNCDLNFDFESFDKKNKICDEKNGKCLIIFSDSYETSGVCGEFEMSYKQRSQANARERCRTHSSLFSVNSAFTTLRLLIPTEPKNRKLSKIETLRLAKSYISHLSSTLMAENTSCRQPCFEASKRTSSDGIKNDYRTNICTFCVSSVIHQKRIN